MPRRPAPATPRKPAEDGDRNPVRVCLRIRPLLFGEAADGDSCITELDERSTTIKLPGGDANSKLARFTFSRVFNGEQSSQHEVFETTTLPLVADLLQGKNALLFTYGITNSGKTFTMEGPQSNPGIVKRLLAVVFNSIRDNRADSCVFRINKTNGVDILVRLLHLSTSLLPFE